MLLATQAAAAVAVFVFWVRETCLEGASTVRGRRRRLGAGKVAEKDRKAERKRRKAEQEQRVREMEAHSRGG